MPSNTSNGRTKRHKVGWVAVGYSKADDFWYSSEGVFGSPEEARADLEYNYYVDSSYAVKIPLDLSKGVKKQ